jgi:hypothetical protein
MVLIYLFDFRRVQLKDIFKYFSLLIIFCGLFFCISCKDQGVIDFYSAFKTRMEAQLALIKSEYALYEPDANQYKDVGYNFNDLKKIASQNISGAWIMRNGQLVSTTGLEWDEVQKIVEARSQLPEIEKLYKWTEYCFNKLPEMKSRIDSLQTTLALWEKSYLKWRSQQTDDAGLLIAGDDLGMDGEVLCPGKWYYNITDQYIKPSSPASEALQKKFTYSEDDYAKMKASFGL